MFHLQSLELLHWDYCQRLTLPLDGAIITVAGPNGSGKTTLLDAMRTLLGLECSGGRSYKTYARHANADSAWLRATVDNRPQTRQASSQFAVLYPASKPASPARPNVPRVFAFSLIAGAVLGGVLAMTREYLDKTVHDARMLQHEFDQVVLAEVPHFRRKRA